MYSGWIECNPIANSTRQGSNEAAVDILGSQAGLNET